MKTFEKLWICDFIIFISDSGKIFIYIIFLSSKVLLWVIWVSALEFKFIIYCLKGKSIDSENFLEKNPTCYTTFEADPKHCLPI